MLLNEFETGVLAWYRTLTPYERLLLNYWLLTGDARSLLAAREHSKRLQCFHYLPVADGCDELSLHR